jgi:hypothetical protein
MKSPKKILSPVTNGIFEQLFARYLARRLFLKGALVYPQYCSSHPAIWEGNSADAEADRLSLTNRIEQPK